MPCVHAGIVYHVQPHAVDLATGLARVCKTCYTSLAAKRIPVAALAHFDTGRLPDGLEPLTMAEQLALCPARAMRMFYYTKGTERDGGLYGDGQREGKGHVIAFMASSPEAWTKLQFPCSPGDLPGMLTVVLLAPPKPGQTKAEAVIGALRACRQLQVNGKKLAAWARHLATVFKQCGTELGIPVEVDEASLKQ